jgi:hypothetical protein
MNLTNTNLLLKKRPRKSFLRFKKNLRKNYLNDKIKNNN